MEANALEQPDVPLPRKKPSPKVIDLRPIPLDKIQELMPDLPKAKAAPPTSITLGEVQNHLSDIDEGKPDKPHSDKEMSHASQMLIEHNNEWRALGQRTSPVIAKHQPNYLADAVETDAGFSHYKDENGKLTQIPEGHVIMQDPSDGKHKIYKRSKDTDEGILLGLGRMALMGATGGSMPVPRRGMAAASNTMKAIQRVEDATGVDIHAPKVAVSDSAPMQKTARTLSRLPGGSAPLVEGAETMAQDLGKAAGRASEIPAGMATNAEIAGGAVRSSATEYIQPGAKGLLNQKVNAAYDKVDALMPPEHLMKNSAMPETTKVAQSAQKEFESMRKTGIDPNVQEVLDAVTHPDGITYKGLKRLRHNIGQLLEKTPEGMDSGTLRRLYGSLTADLKETVLQRRVDGSVPLDASRRLQLWERANNMAAAAAQRREKIAKVLGADTKSDEAIFHAVVRAAGTGAGADAKLLSTLKKSVDPQTWNEVASGVIGQLGRRGEEFNPGQFLRDYAKISDHAKETLFHPEVRKALDDIAHISERWGVAKGLAHKSGEVTHAVGLLGVFHHPLEFLTSMTGINMVSRALAKPATAKSVANWADRYAAFAVNPSKNGHGNVMLMKATQQLGNTLSQDEDTREAFAETVKAGGKIALTGAAIGSHLVKRMFGMLDKHED